TSRLGVGCSDLLGVSAFIGVSRKSSVPNGDIRDVETKGVCGERDEGNRGPAGTTLDASPEPSNDRPKNKAPTENAESKDNARGSHAGLMVRRFALDWWIGHREHECKKKRNAHRAVEGADSGWSWSDMRCHIFGVVS